MGERDEHIEPMLVVSTGNLTQVTCNALSAEAVDGVRAIPHEYGVIVPVRDPAEEPELPVDLEAALALARRLECNWLNFDQDGGHHPDLEVFEW